MNLLRRLIGRVETDLTSLAAHLRRMRALADINRHIKEDQ